MVTSTLLTVVVIPAAYALWREWELRRAPVTQPRPSREAAVARVTS